MEKFLFYSRIRNFILVDNRLLIFDCDERDKLFKIKLMMTDNIKRSIKHYWLEADPLDYVYDASANRDETVCALAIVANQRE